MDSGHSKQAADADNQQVPDIDVSLIDESLRLTPWERLVENDRALALVRMLEHAGRKLHGPAKPVA